MKDAIKLSPKYGLNPTIPICFWCGEEKNEVALCGHIGDGRKHEDFEAPRRALVNYEPCDHCKEMMEQGFTVMEATTDPNFQSQPPMQKDCYPTGAFSVIKREAADRIFDHPSADKAFVDRELYQKLFGAKE